MEYHVKLLLVAPALCIRPPILVLEPLLPIWLPTNVPWRQQWMVRVLGALATHVGIRRVLNFWFQSGLDSAVASIWGMKQQVEELSLSFSVPVFISVILTFKYRIKEYYSLNFKIHSWNS